MGVLDVHASILINYLQKCDAGLTSPARYVLILCPRTIFTGIYQVPNVKLRPAPADALPRSISERCLAEDSQVGSDDTTFTDSCPRPFKGLVLCATGIKDKARGLLFSGNMARD